MFRKYRLFFLLAAVFAFSPEASAQFYLEGSDPFGRWSELGTAHFRIIYPAGLDSLARTYAISLETWHPSVGLSAGMAPGSGQWGKTPVILHAFHPYSNGSVVWAPKRMDLFTRPDPYGSLPQSWVTQLAVHESRHLLPKDLFHYLQ